MVTANEPRNRRILIIDDSEDIHADFRRILTPPRSDTSALDALEAAVLGAAPAARGLPPYELGSAYQGAEALEKVRQSCQAGTPYALAFVDIRMPPGWDGVETLGHLWEADAALQAVICSAYSDYSWETLSERVGQTDRLLFLRKPFDAVEVRQMAFALTEKWNQERQIEAVNRRLQVQYEVARSLMEATSLEEAAPRVLRAIGVAFDWPFGAMWLLEGDGRTLRCTAAWGDDEETARLAAATVGTTRVAYEGPVGRALAWTAPEYREDVDQVAAQIGLRSVIRCPIRIGGQGAGVLALARREGKAPPPELFDLLYDSSSRIAHVLESRRVATALRESEARAAAESLQRKAQEDILRARAEALLALSTPLIPISDAIVIMPLVGEMDGERMGRLVETLAEGVSARSARVVILDVTGVPRLGPEAADGVVRAAQAIRLLGAEMIVTGVRPEVAQALIGLDTGLGGIVTRRTLQSGVACAMARLGGGR